MSIQISELRPAELPEAIAFAAAQGSTLTGPSIRSATSLLARREGRIIGAVFHARDARGHRLELALDHADTTDTTDTADPADPADPARADAPDADSTQAHLARTLLDKALLKMRPRGVATARITPLGDHASARLWPDTRWSAEPAPAP